MINDYKLYTNINIFTVVTLLAGHSQQLLSAQGKCGVLLSFKFVLHINSLKRVSHLAKRSYTSFTEDSVPLKYLRPFNRVFNAEIT